MPDDVLRSEDVVVDEREIADAGHDELQRDAGAARAASGDQNPDVGERRDVEERLNTLEGAIIHGASVLSGHSPVLRHLA